MKDTGLRFAAHIADFGSQLMVLAYKEGPYNERIALVEPVPLTLTRCENPDASVEEPTFRLPIKEAQSLFDAMWREGMRPTGFKNEPQPDSIAAREAHIADLRAVVFGGWATKPLQGVSSDNELRRPNKTFVPGGQGFV